MKTYIYYYHTDSTTFSMNFKAQDIKEAYEIASIAGLELVGGKIEEIEVDREYENGLNLSQYQREFRSWFNSLGE